MADAFEACNAEIEEDYRKGRALSSKDVTHYQHMVVTLKETLRLMKKIEKAIVK